jgi:hypothetical protein
VKLISGSVFNSQAVVENPNRDFLSLSPKKLNAGQIFVIEIKVVRSKIQHQDGFIPERSV